MCPWVSDLTLLWTFPRHCTGLLGHGGAQPSSGISFFVWLQEFVHQEAGHGSLSGGAGVGGRCPSCSRDSSHPSRSRQQSTRRSAVIGDFFNSLCPLNPLTFKASTYGPVPSPRVRLTLDPRAGTAGLAKDQQPLFSLFSSLCSRGSIHFANGTWSPCILGEPEGNPCSISERVL